MCTVRLYITMASAALLACGARSYDWAPTRTTIDSLLPPGTLAPRVVTVLDSLAFIHNAFSGPSSVLRARKREPPSPALVYSTLLLTIRFDSAERLQQRTWSQAFTGP